MRLFFLIRSLDHGGAERQLIELVKALDRSRYQITVATFYDGGKLRPALAAIEGVRVVSLGKRGRWDVLPFIVRLLSEVRRARPDIVHGYLNVANELALLAGRVVGAKVVWGLRMSSVDWTRYERVSRVSARIGALLSGMADLHIANSEAGRAAYAESGYPADRIVVIPNGIDTMVFFPDAVARARIRHEWGVDDATCVVASVGRIDPQKDHASFLRAAALLARRRPDVRFVVVGDGPEPLRVQLEALADELRLTNRIRWIRGSNEMRSLYNAFDVLALTSAYGEGFPNVVGEAMACGTPVVATDVGDASRVVSDGTLVVPPRDPVALDAAFERLLRRTPSDRRALGDELRERISQHFSVRTLAIRTAAVLDGLR